MEKFKLADCLTQLRDDLSVVAKKGKGSSIKFGIDEVSLEFQVVAGLDKEAKGRVKWWIIGADAGVKASDATTQKLSLKLRVVDAETGEVKPIAGTTKRPSG